MRQGGGERLLGKTNLHGKGFETSQRTLGLVEVVDFILDEGTKCLIRGSDIECLHKNEGELFDFYWYATDHQNDLIGILGYILVHPTL